MKMKMKKRRKIFGFGASGWLVAAREICAATPLTPHLPPLHSHPLSPFLVFYETHLPALEADPQEAVWIPRADEDEEWPRHPFPPARPRPQAAPAQGRGGAFRAPYRSL